MTDNMAESRDPIQPAVGPVRGAGVIKPELRSERGSAPAPGAVFRALAENLERTEMVRAFRSSAFRTLASPQPPCGIETGMKLDVIKQFVILRKSLLTEKAKLEARLHEISKALTHNSVIDVLTASPKQRRASRKPRAKGLKRAKNALSLKAAVLKVTQKPMSKAEILAAVKKLGYKFTTKAPLNSLGVILYGKQPKFRNDNGKFSVAKP
jgi:hypothetical protein